MKAIELINLLPYIQNSIVAMDSEYKRQRFNLVLEKLKKSLNNDKPDCKTPERVRYLVGRFYKLPSNYHENKTRKREFVQARQQCMTYLREKRKMTLQSVADLFGKDHATVDHSMKTVNNLCMTDRKYNQQYKRLLKFIYNS
jgi:chromosomal replication initiation ATPase DnaA